ncbi:MAG: GNAT family N-acetyltransferase [Nocardioidaceae bacterium]
MNVEIRPREAADIPALAQVLVRVHAKDGYPVEGVAEPDAWLSPARELAAWTALFDGRPIGHMSLTQADETDEAAVLWQKATGGDLDRLAIPVRLFVDPPHRQRGAGKLLMLAAHDYASRHHYEMAFDVMLKDEDAIRLYEALGCRRLGLSTHRHGDGLAEPSAVYVAPR